MNFFWIINAKRLKNILLIVTSAFIAATIAFMHNQQVAVFTTSDTPRAISKIDTEQKQLALTFDLSSGDVQILSMLKTLKKEDIQATFFISASWAKQHRDIVKKMMNSKHELASHGYQQKNYRSMKQGEMREDMKLARQAIQKMSGQKTTLLRTPKSHFDKQVLQAAEESDYTVIDWSVDCEDLMNPDPQAIVNSITEHASSGDIIRLDASDAAKQTSQALPLIIDELKDQGFTFETVSKLLSDAQTETKLVK